MLALGLPIEVVLGVSCREASGEESLSRRRELLSAEGIGYFDGRKQQAHGAVPSLYVES